MTTPYDFTETLTDIVQRQVTPKVLICRPLDRDGLDGFVRWGNFQISLVLDGLWLHLVKKLKVCKENKNENIELFYTKGPIKGVIDDAIYKLAKEIVKAREAI